MTRRMRFLVFFTIVFGIWALEHLYVGWRLSSLPIFAAPPARRLLVLGLLVGFALYPLGRVVFHRGGEGSGRVLEYVGGVWMGILLLLFFAFLVVDIVTLFGLVLRPWLTVLRSGATAVALVLAAIAWIGGSSAPRVIDLEVELPRLPASADGLVVVQLSDLHLGSIIGRKRLVSTIAQIETRAPDVIVVTGDLVDGDAGVVETLLPELRTLTAPLGVYAVLGNHEYYAGAERCRELMRDAGYTVLDNAAVEVTPGLWVAGVPDDRGSRQTGDGEADFGSALADVGEGAVVLLQHSPGDEEAAAIAGVGLMLNGHTHGGQIWPFHFLVRRAYPHIAGVRRVGAMTQVICRGAGYWGPPMRLFAPSEIYRITLRSPVTSN
jgi:predicted MPP superfamily phosphohydrolase